MTHRDVKSDQTEIAPSKYKTIAKVLVCAFESYSCLCLDKEWTFTFIFTEPQMKGFIKHFLGEWRSYKFCYEFVLQFFAGLVRFSFPIK